MEFFGAKAQEMYGLQPLYLVSFERSALLKEHAHTCINFLNSDKTTVGSGGPPVRIKWIGDETEDFIPKCSCSKAVSQGSCTD